MSRGGRISLLAALVLVSMTDAAHAQRWSRGGNWNRGGVTIGFGNYGYGAWGYGNNYGYGNYYSPWGYGYRGYYPHSTGYYSPQYYGNTYTYSYPTTGYYSQPNMGYYYNGAVQYQQPVQQVQATQPMQQADAMASGMKARLRVMMPAPDARLIINGSQMQQMGSDRVFESPALEPNKSYTYTLEATWMENGREVTRQQEVKVQPGQETVASFRSEMTGAQTDSMYRTPREESGKVVAPQDPNRNPDQPRNDPPRDPNNDRPPQ